MSDTESWEYRVQRVSTNNLAALQVSLNQLGSTGWEVVGFAAADKTLGLNEYAAILKRRTIGVPPPDDASPGWKIDPFERYQYRWWNGRNWEAAVNTDGTDAVDWPTQR